MDAKEILDFLGVDAESIDQFKEQFGSKYFTEQQIHSNKDLLNRFTGKTMGKAKTNLLNNARDLDIPFTAHEFDDVPIEETAKILKQRQKDAYEAKLTELKGQLGKTGEEAIKPYQEKISKYEQSLADELKAKKQIAADFEAFKQESENKIKSTRIDYFKKDLMTSIDYDPTTIKDDLKRKGWESHVAENFRFDFDEQDQPIIMDKTGSKIKNPKKADEWLSPKDVLIQEAERLGLTKKNPQGGTPVRPSYLPPVTNRPAPAAPPAGEPAPRPLGRKLAPGMEGYLSK